MKRLVVLLALSVFAFYSLALAGPYGPGAPSTYDPPTGKGQPPASPGQYRIHDSEGKLKYLGDAQNLKRRIGEHKRSGKIEPGDKVKILKAKPDATTQERRDHEAAKIRKHQPRENKRAGGGGRYPKD